MAEMSEKAVVPARPIVIQPR